MSVKAEELLEEISGYLHGYLKVGKVKINSFLSKINVNISNLEQLLTIRFLLRSETKDFARALPMLLKHFKTTTVMKSDMHIGEVRGQIDWAQTTKERLARNHKDKTIFSTNESIRSYNIPENLVLKELLGHLYTFLYQNAYIKGFEKAPWFFEWQELKANVIQAYKKNIYLQRVDIVHVSDRVLQKTINHRNRLYRQAAKLLLAYRRLINGQFSEEEIKQLLRETFIEPDNEDVLFELYWVIQLLKQNTDESQLYLMDGSQSMIASWNDDSLVYRLYHDSIGSGVVQFRIPVAEIEGSDNGYLQRKYCSVKDASEIVQSVFGRNQSTDIWRGRPDILMEVCDRDTMKLVKVVIGEVKNTADTGYAITGVKELLDYLHYVKDNKGAYILSSGVKVEGLLCVDDVGILNSNDGNRISIVKYGDRIDLR